MMAVLRHCARIPGDTMVEHRLPNEKHVWIKGTGFAGAVVALWGLILVTPGWSKSPNVVLITIDTVRADRVGCYGYQQAHTPNLDALAGEEARKEAEGESTLAGRKCGEQLANGNRQQHAAGESLEDATDDEEGKDWRDTAQQG